MKKTKSKKQYSVYFPYIELDKEKFDCFAQCFKFLESFPKSFTIAKIIISSEFFDRILKYELGEDNKDINKSIHDYIKKNYLNGKISLAKNFYLLRRHENYIFELNDKLCNSMGCFFVVSCIVTNNDPDLEFAILNENDLTSCEFNSSTQVYDPEIIKNLTEKLNCKDENEAYKLLENMEIEESRKIIFEIMENKIKNAVEKNKKEYKNPDVKLCTRKEFEEDFGVENN